MADAFRQQQLYLHPEKSIEDMNKYRSIKNHDRTASVPDDENENIIFVSRIRKMTRSERRCAWADAFRQQQLYLHTEKSIEIMKRKEKRACGTLILRLRLPEIARQH